ncbi:hypothetical protein ACIRBY_05935 [Streptomyces sp. NPDC096136]|uniref:hypothetical protein n=1 Tax=Streptomyces sp. NPDC096136 TaxID=3366076 RepID=UPI00382933BE
MTIVAPNSTLNTGLVTGGQRHTVSTSPSGDPGTAAMRQGPVRPEGLKAMRRRFVPPPGFDAALAALDSGVCLLVGAPGTGRETVALNLLAHGTKDPVLVQIDGATDLTRWGPPSRGVHGYLMMEPSDPFSLRAWHMARLEALLAQTQARFLIVLADVPSLVTTLADQLGMPVLHHLPPDPRRVFAAHLAEACPHEEVRAGLLASLGPRLAEELLPADLPPRYAAQAAEAVARLGVTHGVSPDDVLDVLTRAEASELVARVLEDPVLFAHLSSLSVFGGLERAVVVRQAAELLELAGGGSEPRPDERIPARRPGWQQSTATPQRPLSDILRLLGARCTPQAEPGAGDTASFFWPAVGEAAWRVLCREHTDLLPLMHAWLARTEEEEDQIQRAGQALQAMAVATGGRSLDFLRELALAPRPAAVEVAAWCLAAATGHRTVTARAADLLEDWSAASETVLRRAVAYACRVDCGGLSAQSAFCLIQRVMGTLSEEEEDVVVGVALAEALLRRFEAGDTAARATILGGMCDWIAFDGAPCQWAALLFPLMAGADLAWCDSQIRSGSSTTSAIVALTAHALNESVAYASMRDVLLMWCHEAHAVARPHTGLEDLLAHLVDSRQPGFLRWLLAAARNPDGTPGRDLAGSLLHVWRSKAPTPHVD